jgi:hypothetical protein
MRTKAALLMGCLIAGSVPALAHHSPASEYDMTKPVKVTGVVTKLEWTNPHIWVYVDVKGEDGKVVNWGFLGPPPGLLMRRGIGKASVKPGTVLNV